jgi:hypothetical protein
MLRRLALVRTDVSGELSASIIRVTRIGELGTTLAVTRNRLVVTANDAPSSPILVTLMMEAQSSSETSVHTRATWRNIPEDAILHSHHSENLKSYKQNTLWSLVHKGTIPTYGRRLSAKWVQTFAGRQVRVVSASCSHSRYSWLCRPGGNKTCE